MRTIGLVVVGLLMLAGESLAQCQSGQCQAPQARQAMRAAQPARTVVYNTAPAPEPMVVYREVRQAPPRMAVVYEAPPVVYMAPPVVYRAAPAPVLLAPVRTRPTPVRDFLFGR